MPPGSPREANSGISKPRWNHLVIMRWYNQSPNVCFECGKPIGFYDPNRVHHLVPQQNWKHYSIDIINDTTNLVKLGSRFECDCHGKAENGKAPKTKELAIKKKDEYTKYRIP